MVLPISNNLFSSSYISLQTHLICTVPSYINQDIIEPAPVQLFITSSNKCSESHNFIYTPKNNAFGSHSALAMATTLAALQAHTHSSNSQGILWVFMWQISNHQIEISRDKATTDARHQSSSIETRKRKTNFSLRKKNVEKEKLQKEKDHKHQNTDLFFATEKQNPFKYQTQKSTNASIWCIFDMPAEKNIYL